MINTNTTTVETIPDAFVGNSGVEEGCKTYNITDYSIFEHLVGNRNLKQENVRQIEKSIMEKGYSSGSFIKINEKCEVIDGQHRIQAILNIYHKTGKKIPIPTIVLGGATIEDVMLINQNRKNWGPSEFDESYAAQGNPHYTFLQGMKKKYEGKLGEEIVAKVICHVCDISKKERLDGLLVVPTDRMIRIHNILDYMARYADVVKEIKHRTNCTVYNSWNFYNALLFCAFYSCDYGAKNVDLEHMLSAFKKVAASVNPPRIDGYTEGNVKLIDGVYNANRLKKNQVSFEAAFILAGRKF